MIKAFFDGLIDFFNFSWLSPIYPRSYEQSDYDAIKSDWEVVGKDMENAIRIFEAENE